MVKEKKSTFRHIKDVLERIFSTGPDNDGRNDMNGLEKKDFNGMSPENIEELKRSAKTVGYEIEKRFQPGVKKEGKTVKVREENREGPKKLQKGNNQKDNNPKDYDIVI